MKSLWQNRRCTRAFTLVEMLVVIAIIAVLAALLLPALVRGKQRALRVQCIGHLKEMGTAFQIFAHDHKGRFPMQTPQAEGGSAEFVTAGNNINGPFYFSFRHLQTLANELVVPRMLVCPADLQREPAASFGVLQNSNVSYFVGVYADYNTPSSVLAGDRNIESDANTPGTLLRGGSGLHWTSELHFFKGNILFADSHVEQMNSPHVAVAALGPGTVIVLPTAKPPPGAGSIPGIPGGSSPSPGPRSPPASSGGPGMNNSPSAQPMPQRITAPKNADTKTPPPPAPIQARSGTTGSRIAPQEGSSFSTPLIETAAKETNGDAAISAVTPPPAAPAAEDDEQPPLLWLMGAARELVTKSSWWLLILLAALMGTALWLYARRKMRQPRRR